MSKFSNDSEMRVLIVSEPCEYGVFYFVDDLIHYLSEHGVHIDFAYSSFRSGPALKSLVRFVEQNGGKTLNLQVTNAPQPRDVSAFIRLREFVRRRKPDVIHGHSSKAGVLVRALRMTGVRIPIFYSPHAYYGMGGKQTGRPSLLRIPKRATQIRFSGSALRTALSSRSVSTVSNFVPPLRKSAPVFAGNWVFPRTLFSLARRPVTVCKRIR
jgi:hypothetical protein